MTILPIKLPDVGEGVTEAELAEWHVDVGDVVREDDIIAAIMTDKATVEIPSLYDGKIVERTGEVGDMFAVGSDLVKIETSSEEKDISSPATSELEAVTPLAPKKPANETSSLPDQACVTPNVSIGPPRAEGDPVLASPALRARAREAGVDLRQVPGTGPAGRITDGDLDTYFSAGMAPRNNKGATGKRYGSKEIKLVGLRRKIAEQMTRSKSRIPHITIVEEIDVSALEDLRRTLNETRGEKPKLTMIPFIATALCKAVEEHKEMNAHFDDETDKVTQHAPVHIGIATMTENGLMVPVLRHAEALGLIETADEIFRLSEAARTGSASREELTGSTITVTSLGPLGAIATTPIINHPEVAILGINKMAIRPHWDGQQFVPRKMMNISASFDHRVIDGWDAAVFVRKMKTLLETPALIFMEGV